MREKKEGNWEIKARFNFLLNSTSLPLSSSRFENMRVQYLFVCFHYVVKMLALVEIPFLIKYFFSNPTYKGLSSGNTQVVSLP